MIRERQHTGRIIHGAGTALAFVAAALLANAAVADETPNAQAQQQQIDALTKQLQAIQAQLQELAAQNKKLLEQQQRTEAREQSLERQLAQTPAPAANAPAPATAAAIPPGVNPVPPGSNPVPPGSNPVPPPANPVPPTGPLTAQSGYMGSYLGGVKLWGYGEIYYTHPTHDYERTEADLARAVFGIGYSFNDRTEFNSEFEVEHAVASASDPGEFEVEQFYIDRQLNDSASLRAGLFLMPFGLLNEHHEPTNFYGVQRNFVETLIIPSTWREGGLNLHGDTPFGLNWSAGITTGFDLSKWNFAPEFPLYTTALDLEDSDSAPLQATHQELALANGKRLSQYVALNYLAVPGLDIGAAISSGDAVKTPAPPNAPIPGNQRVTLWEAHTRWTPGKFDLSALYAHGSISNLTLANFANPGSPNPIPSQFYGYYLQGAYQAWEHDDYRLAPFLRWEYYDMGSRYEGTPGPVLPNGSVPLSANPGDYGYWPVNRDRVWTVGANLYVTPHLVFKLDYQTFELNKDFTRIDLGLGLAF
jgi:opacity protein-like surface antigen